MSDRRLRAASALLFTLALSACDKSEERPGFVTSTAAGSGASAGAAGTAGVARPLAGSCGDGRIDEGEDCDGTLVPSCGDLGFSEGTTSCTSECKVVSRDCWGSERCSDGIDNDGDGLVDCLDPDCARTCASTCAEPELLSDPVVIAGSTATRPNQLRAPCSMASGSGPEVAFGLRAEHTGVLEVSLTSNLLFNVAILDTCSTRLEPLACGMRGASARVAKGQLVYILVDGVERSDSGAFELSARSRPLDVCGDGRRDPGEQCEDGNRSSGDGCDAQCRLEATELENNDTPSKANAYSTPFYAQIAPAGDVDVVSVLVPSNHASLIASTLNFGDGACAMNQMDSYIELLAADGQTVIGDDDDGGDGHCARLIASRLLAGTYYVRVKAAPGGSAPTFPYRLDVSIDACGNGFRSLGEACDDGNTVSGDGCSSSCELERP
jgi:cysteine-rich repeat protein